MYTSHSRRMSVFLMPPSQTVSEIFSHKPHTEVFFPLHHHTKFPVHTESLRRCLAKPVLRTSPSSRLGMCSSVQIPCSKLPFLPCCLASRISFLDTDVDRAISAPDLLPRLCSPPHRRSRWAKNVAPKSTTPNQRVNPPWP